MFRLIAYFTFIFLIISSSYGQSADEVITKSLQVRGGKSMFKNLRTLSFSAKINIKGQFITMQSYVQYPNKLKVELKNPLGEVVTTVFDGKKGWVIKDKEIKKFPEGSYNILRAQIDSQIGFFYKNLYNYKKRKYALELSGEGETRNTPVYKVKITEPDGTEWLAYISKDRNFDIRYDLLKDINGNKQTSSFHIKNFVPVGGYYFASGADIFINNTESGSVSFSDITVNPKFNKSLFIIPKK
jgi:outer membrane lipoprotein-sorting protein